jgi:hypothetical protein
MPRSAVPSVLLACWRPSGPGLVLVLCCSHHDARGRAKARSFMAAPESQRTQLGWKARTDDNQWTDDGSIALAGCDALLVHGVISRAAQDVNQFTDARHG